MTTMNSAHPQPRPRASTISQSARDQHDFLKKYSILAVDDEPKVLESLKRLFTLDNCKFYLAANASDALAILKQTAVNLIIADYRMPGMNGMDLLKVVQREYPSTIRIMLTGVTDINSIVASVNDGTLYKFITKPWNNEDLRLNVNLALKQFDLMKENTELKKMAKVADELVRKDEIDVVLDEDQPVNFSEILQSTDIAPAVGVVNAIFLESLQLGASDVHIEPKNNKSIVRHRIDGMLHSKTILPLTLHPAIVSRIKILAKMDIAEKRIPQDGRITLKSGERVVDVRVSTMPTVNGEKIVFRILDTSSSIRTLDELGVVSRDKKKIELLVNKPQGIIISTGPTGSGKTTLLYSLLNMMLESTKNYQTIEDPVEYFLDDANQIFVKEKSGLSFPSVLRATLRQDPDVILVGEIRDFETADVAFKAALTGHLVLSSLHTNSSVASITRLIDMKVPSYLIASAIEGIIAQRLVRKICNNCRVEMAPSETALHFLRLSEKDFQNKVYAGQGCDKCDNSGYAGRTGIFELFLMNDDFRQLISSSSYKEAQLTKMAKAGGMLSLLENSIEKVTNGETTLSEVVRVLGAQTKYDRECSHCKAMIEVNFLYCPFCGIFNKNYCHFCKIPLEEEWQVCPTCGEKKGTHHK